MSGKLHIADGTGSQHLAKVNDSQQLSVISESRSGEESHAIHGHSFIFHKECHLAAASSGGLLYFLNESQLDNVIITRIYIDPHTITPTDLVVVQVKNPDSVSDGTDISSEGIVNKRFDDNAMLDGTLKCSDSSSDLTYTGGTQYHAFPIKTMTPLFRDMKGTNVITPGSSILWGWKTVSGGNATNGEIISLSINCYLNI